MSPLFIAAGAEVAREARPSDVARLGINDSDVPDIPRPESDLLIASRLLLDAGASLSKRDQLLKSTPLGWASSGSDRRIRRRPNGGRC